jgi:hypothetical protein
LIAIAGVVVICPGFAIGACVIRRKSRQPAIDDEKGQPAKSYEALQPLDFTGTIPD